MSETNNFSIAPQYLREYKDRLFIAIFGKNTKDSKKWRLELYNALNNTNYSDPEALELNTIENVLYIKMHNDVSFMVDSQMTLYEQQSSPNPNMPLRGLLYFSQLYQKHISLEGRKLISEQLVKIPNPNFIVFYNGKSERPEQYDLHLSDAFIQEEKNKRFEWTAHVININENHNLALQKKCKPLYDYIRFIARINHNKDEMLMSMNDAVNEAVDWAMKENLLDGLVKAQKQEIIGMLLTEYDEEACIKTWQEDGYVKGFEKGDRQRAIEDAKNLYANGVSIELIAKSLKMTVEKVKELVADIVVTQD